MANIGANLIVLYDEVRSGTCCRKHEIVRNGFELSVKTDETLKSLNVMLSYNLTVSRL